jgi:hypothetical protein
MEELAALLNPVSRQFQKLLQGCRCNVPAGRIEKWNKPTQWEMDAKHNIG